MAIPDVLGSLLLKTVQANALGGAFLMLGRQRFVGSRKGRSAKQFASDIAQHLPGVAEADLRNSDDIYSERFFQALGFTTVDSLDFSDFEGASIIHDLTQPVGDDLVDRFDVIYDGGTCEHVFELPTAYRNIDRMLRRGGVLIGHSPSNNWINHGFYQIGPEMVYGFWEKAMGYEVIDLLLQPTLPAFVHQSARTTNPNVTGNRPRIQGDLPGVSPIIMHYVVRKPTSGAFGGRAYQTDYQLKWKESDAD